MATYTNSLRLVLPATGEYPGTWGVQANNGLTSLVDTSVAGTATITMTAADYTLSTANGASDEARAAILNVVGTPGAARNIIVPAVSKLYVVYNNTTGGFAQTVKTSAGTGVSVPNGATAYLRCDGTNVVAAVNYLGSLSLGTALPVASGGTGAATFTANNVLLGNGTSAFQVVAPGTNGNVLTSNGTTWASTALPASVTTISFGTTGLTPNSATSGAVTVAGTLAAANGGTGQSSYAVGDLLFASTTTALSKLADVATGNALISGGVGVAPSYGKIGLTTHISGTLAVGNGGTGATTLTANNVILGNGTSAVQFVAPGANGNVLTSNGTTWTSAAAGASLLGQTDSASPFETSLGYQAGNVSTGTANTFIGYQAGLSNTTGNDNTAVGYQSLDANTIGNNNVAFGSNALGANTSGGNNAAFGYNALQINTTGSSNTALGRFTLSSNTTGDQNVAVGTSSLTANTTGGFNVAVGVDCLDANTFGNNNVALGYAALGVNTTGSNNTAVGYNAGSNISTGTNLTCLGNGATASAATATNEITLGNSSIATIRAQVTTITALSDARDKTNIAPLSAGLAFTNALKPVAFTWNMRDGGKVGVPDTGFIAQDLKAAQEQTGINIPGLVYESNPDRLEAGYGKLLPVLVKAIQELSAEVESLKAQLKGN